MAVVPSRGWRVSSRGEEVFTDFFDSLWSQCCCRHVGGEAVESGGIVAHVRCSLCRCHSTLGDRGWCLGVVADRCLVVVVLGYRPCLLGHLLCSSADVLRIRSGLHLQKKFREPCIFSMRLKCKVWGINF